MHARHDVSDELFPFLSSGADELRLLLSDKREDTPITTPRFNEDIQHITASTAAS